MRSTGFSVRFHMLLAIVGEQPVAVLHNLDNASLIAMVEDFLVLPMPRYGSLVPRTQWRHAV